MLLTELQEVIERKINDLEERVLCSVLVSGIAMRNGFVSIDLKEKEMKQYFNELTEYYFELGRLIGGEQGREYLSAAISLNPNFKPSRTVSFVDSAAIAAIYDNSSASVVLDQEVVVSKRSEETIGDIEVMTEILRYMDILAEKIEHHSYLQGSSNAGENVNCPVTHCENAKNPGAPIETIQEVKVPSTDVFENMRKTGEFSDLCIDHLVRKAEVSKRRKKNLNGHGNDTYGQHGSNMAGTYRNEELRKGPKFYRDRKPTRAETSIRSYEDIKNAILDIQNGDRNHDHFRNVNGLNRERLRYAQSLRDRGIGYNVSDIVKISLSEIQRNFHQRLRPFGVQY